MAAAVAYLVLRVSLGAICLWAGAEKARGLNTFAHGVAGYRLLPLSLARPVAVAIVFAELVVGGLLIVDVAPVLAAAGAIGLFTVFAVALGASLARGDRGPCHCFGASDAETISPLALIRALALAAMAAVTLVLAGRDLGLPPNDAILPSLLMAAGITFTVRVSSLFPLTWSFFKTEPALYPTPTSKVSYRHQPLDVPLLPQRPDE
jgi:Methylamine utilisation protein MauE